MKLERINAALQARLREYKNHTYDKTARIGFTLYGDNSGCIEIYYFGEHKREFRVFSFNNKRELKQWVYQQTPDWNSENAPK